MSIRIVLFKEVKEALGLLPGNAGWQSFLEVMRSHEQKIWVAAADLPCGMLVVSSLRSHTLLPMFISKVCLKSVGGFTYLRGELLTHVC